LLVDGLLLSHDEIAAALEAIWPLTDELFQADPVTDRPRGSA
jgi:hypothetical protein